MHEPTDEGQRALLRHLVATLAYRAANRFFAGLDELDRAIASTPTLGYPPEILIQGPIADALTHVGQLAMLRGAAGAPVRPESYARADIAAGRVGLEQVAPRREFDGDASAPRPTTA